MLDARHIRELVVRPALQAIDLWSPAAEDLVLGTGLVESRFMFLRQLGGGPALGLWQMEPATHDDVWRNFLDFRPELGERVGALAAWRKLPMIEPAARAGELAWNLRYAAALCRVHYRRAPAPLPEAGDVDGYAAYWKRFYNTAAGAGTAAAFAALYRRHLV